MFKRKIEEVLRLWKMKEDHKPLVIKGCRQCGKTSSVVCFAEQNYEHVVYMDFHEHKEYKAQKVFNTNYQKYSSLAHQKK